jgi:PilZ domain
VARQDLGGAGLSLNEKENDDMEGTCTRKAPRTALDQPVDVKIGDQTLRVESPANNLSVDGMFLRRETLPAGTPVHIRIASRRVFEADGMVCNSGNGERGVGIQFSSLTDGNREALYDLIEDLTLRGLPAA